MTGVSISVSGVSMRYATRGGSVEVLDEFDLTVATGERVAIMGPSGAGKTTLLALIGGLEAIQHGRIRVGDIDLATLHGDALAAYRHRTVGFVFQHFGLLGNLSARENIELAMSFGGRSGRDRRARALALLDAVGIANRADHRPAELSGGESQRVALARALA
ncbi:MAG: ATP-binding cassette domain-containing protein, partial [Acidimicrobiia bacterium]